MSRRVIVAAGSIAAICVIAAGCATKVGDRKPTSFTTFDPDRPVIDLTQSEGIRMCLDAKKILTNDEKLRAGCAVNAFVNTLYDRTAAAFDVAACHALYDECVGRGASDTPDVSDCHKFALDTRSCGALLIGDLNECLVARGRVESEVARVGGGLCDEPARVFGDPKYSDHKACDKMDHVCAVGRVSLH